MSAQHRKLFLASPADYRKALLTENQIQNLTIIRDWDFPSMTTVEFSICKGLSVQNAGAQLAKLCDKGYLKRTERTCPTGGIIYRYELAQTLNKEIENEF